MKSFIFVILPMLCTCLAFPVPIVKDDDARSVKERSLEELEEQLEGTQKRADVVGSKIQTQKGTTQVLEKGGDHFAGFKPIRREKLSHALQGILTFYVRDHGIKISQAVKLIARVVDLFGQALPLSAEEKLDLERRMATEIVGVLQEDDALIEDLEKEIKSDIITFNLTGDDINLFVRLKMEEKAFLHHLSAQEKEKIFKRIINDFKNKELSPPRSDEIQAIKEGADEWAEKKGLTKEETQVLETVLIGALQFHSSVKPAHTERFHPTPDGTSSIPVSKELLEVELETEEQKPVTEEITPVTLKLILQPTDKEVDQAEAIMEKKLTPTTQTTISETVEITVEKMESDEKAQVGKKNGQSQDTAESELEDLKFQEAEKDTSEGMSEVVHKGTTLTEANPRNKGRQEDDEEEKDLEATEGKTQVKFSSAKHETRGNLQPKKTEILTEEKEAPPAKSIQQIEVTKDKSTPQKVAGELHSNVLVKVEKMSPSEATEKPTPSTKSSSDHKATEGSILTTEGQQTEGEDGEEKDLEALGAKTPSRLEEQIQVKVEKLSPKTKETQSVVSSPKRSERKIIVEKISPLKTVEDEQIKDKEELEVELDGDKEKKASGSSTSELPAVSENTNPEEIDKNKLARDFEEALRKERLTSAKSAVQTTPSTKESNVSTAESAVQPESKAGKDLELEEELERQIEGAKKGKEESERKLDAFTKDTAEQDMEETQKVVATQDDSNGVFVDKAPEVPMETNTGNKSQNETKQKETLPVVVKVEQVPSSGGNKMSTEKAPSVEAKPMEANDDDLTREEEELEKDLEGKNKANDRELESAVSRVKKRAKSKHLEEELEDLLAA